jgi:FtsH-binding integral membrane protein
MQRLVLLLILFIGFSLLILFNKYRDSQTGFLIRFAWFAICIGCFFYFFSYRFSLAVNIFMAAISVGGLSYFGYNLKKMIDK